MPAIITERIEFGNWLYISLEDLHQALPFIKEDGSLEFFIIEIRDNQDKLVKRFKPLERLIVKLDQYYCKIKKEWLPCIRFSDENASKFNLGRDYKTSILTTKYNDQYLFPFELKPLGYGSEKVIETFSKIECRLLTLAIEYHVLSETIGYLHDSYSRLEENDIEGARTSLRKSLEGLQKNFIPQIVPIEETEDFKENLAKLVKIGMGFVHYGGPHPGPAPRTTTEMILEITIDIVEYLAKCLQNGVIKIKG